MRLNILAFAVGVLSLQLQPTLPAWEPWLAAGLFLALPGLIWRNRPVRMLAFAGCIAIGFSWAGWRAETRLADQLGAEWEGRDVELVGVVAGLPQAFAGGTRFEFDVSRVQGGAMVPDKIMLSWYQGRREGEAAEPPALRAGERWQFTVRLKRPHGNANPGVFDYEAWLLERNIRATGYVRANPPQRLANMVWLPGYVVERFRQTVRDSFGRMLPEAEYPFAGVLVALAVGDQKAIQGGKSELKTELVT